MLEFIKNNWMAAAFSGVLAGLGVAMKRLFARVKSEVSEQAKIKAGVLAILHDRLYQSCQFFVKQGFIIPGDLTNLGNLFDSYSGLGGNGTITELYNRVKKLPLNKKED